jgi:hypothetical protein
MLLLAMFEYPISSKLKYNQLIIESRVFAILEVEIVNQVRARVFRRWLNI